MPVRKPVHSGWIRLGQKVIWGKNESQNRKNPLCGKEDYLGRNLVGKSGGGKLPGKFKTQKKKNNYPTMEGKRQKDHVVSGLKDATRPSTGGKRP